MQPRGVSCWGTSQRLSVIHPVFISPQQQDPVHQGQEWGQDVCQSLSWGCGYAKVRPMRSLGPCRQGTGQGTEQLTSFYFSFSNIYTHKYIYIFIYVCVYIYIYIHIYPLSLEFPSHPPFHPSRSSQNTKLSSSCYIAASR